jgi:hypothetical protein
MLAPVLNPLRALINPETLRANYQGRIRIDEEKIDSDALQMHGERFRRLMEDINGFVNMQSDIQPIVREEQRGLKAILELEVFGDRYPFPMSRKYDKLLKYIQGNLGDYPFIWYILFIWNDLRLMGRVITSGQQYASISRSWLDEWGISRILQRTFEELGFDSQQSNSGINVIKLLISQQNWVLDIKQKTALSQMEAWLSEDEIRTVLNVNRYRGKLYFNKEAFETMMWWMMTAALIRLVADPEKSLAEDVEILLDAQLLIEKVLEAEKESEYQVEILLKGLK